MTLQLLSWPDGTRVLTIGMWRHWLSTPGAPDWTPVTPSMYLNVIREATVTNLSL